MILNLSIIYFFFFTAENGHTTVISPTTENLEMISSSTVSSTIETTKMDGGKPQTNEQTTSSNAITTSNIQVNEASSTVPSLPSQRIEIVNEKTLHSTGVTEVVSDDMQEKRTILMDLGNVHSNNNDEPTIKDVNVERETMIDATNSPSITTEPSTSKSDEKNVKPNISRSRVVSKDVIESIRGRALNITNSGMERQQSSSFVYVTPTMPVAKSMNAFSGDLSDVNMDDDEDFGDFHGSARVTATTSTPLIHDSECQSKVGF